MEVIDINERPYKEVSGRNIIMPNDILFARIEPSVFNKKYIYVDNLKGYDFALASTEFYIVKAKNINSRYLFFSFFFDFVYNQVKGKTTGSTGRRRLDKSVFNNLVIPTPDVKIVDKTVKIVEQAIRNKKNKLEHAQSQLDSIDKYLLYELGIKLPLLKNKELKERTFLKNNKELIEDRFDAFYHQNYFDEYIKAVIESRYVVKPLKVILKSNLIKGKLPKEVEKTGDCKVVQINCINSDGNIIFDDILTSKNIFTKHHKLKSDDILIVITGATIGKIAYWQYEGDYYLGGDIVKFQVSNGVEPYYVYSYLRSTFPQIDIKRNITGATNGHLAPQDIKNILIPIPPIEIQNKIAEHITEIRSEAKRIKEEANQELEHAKQEVEKMILGSN